jgi:uncharacterized protein (DUF302 family)
MDRCSSFTSHSFGKLRCFSIQKTSAKGASTGKPDEIAKAVVVLASDNASDVTGAGTVRRWRFRIAIGRPFSERALAERNDPVPVRKVEVERFSLTTSKPFESVVSALKAGIGQLDLAAFASASKSSGTFAELEEVINRNMGETGLMLFLEFDHGAVVRMEKGLAKPKIVRLLIGNPLVMKEMAKHVPDAGSYAPVTVLVDERDDGVHLSYDRMTSFLSPYENPDALKVARELDSKVERLLNNAAVE